MVINRYWLIGGVLLCCLGAGVALHVREPAATTPAKDAFEGFVKIPAYDYATEKLGAQVLPLRPGDLLEYSGNRFSVEDFAATQLVVLKMQSATDAASIFERICLEYPLLEQFPLGAGMPQGEWSGRHGRRLGERHAVFVRGRTVVHICVPQHVENSGELLSEIAQRMYSALQSRLKVDWLAEIEPALFTLHENYERIIYPFGGNVAVFKLTDKADFATPFAPRKIAKHSTGADDKWQPVQIVVLEVRDAAAARRIADVLQMRISVGGALVEDAGFEEPLYVIGNRTVIFTQNNYVVQIVVRAQMEDHETFILDLSRRINAALKAMEEKGVQAMR